MVRIFNELMSGGWTPDDDCDLASDRDIWEDQTRHELSRMSDYELLLKRFDVAVNDPFDAELDELICIELQNRHGQPVCGSLGSKNDPSCPGYCGPEEDDHEDLRKAKLEFDTEADELPF